MEHLLASLLSFLQKPKSPSAQPTEKQLGPAIKVREVGHLRFFLYLLFPKEFNIRYPGRSVVVEIQSFVVNILSNSLPSKSNKMQLHFDML